MFKKILIANRGEIACRVIKSAKKMGIKPPSPSIRMPMSTRCMCAWPTKRCHIGPPPASESYIVIDKIMDAIGKPAPRRCIPATASSPRTPNLPKRWTPAGVAFIGPPVAAIEAMGDKITSKKIAAEAGVSTVPGYMGLVADAEEAVSIADGTSATP